MPDLEKLRQELNIRSKKDHSTGCILFLKPPSKSSRYGCLKTTTARKLLESSAHRLAYIAWKGEIGDFCVLHTCDTPRCINPEHLYLGTLKDNAQDRAKRNRGNRPTGSRHYCAKFTEVQVRDIRQEYANTKITLMQLASKYQVHFSTIQALVKGTKWKGVSLE